MNLKSISYALALTLVLAAAPASAQTAAPPPTSPANAEPTAAQIALARDIVIGSGISRSFAVAVPQFLDQISTRLTQTRPDLIKDLNTVLEQLKPEFDKRVDPLIDKAARAYAQRMSDDEMKQIGAFFKSAAGVKYVDSQPAVLNDFFVAFQAWQQQMSVDMMTRVREEMKKKGHDL